MNNSQAACMPLLGAHVRKMDRMKKGILPPRRRLYPLAPLSLPLLPLLVLVLLLPLLLFPSSLFVRAASGQPHRASAVPHPNIDLLREFMYPDLALDLPLPSHRVFPPLDSLHPHAATLPLSEAPCDHVPVSLAKTGPLVNKMRCAPSFSISGVMKAGTTSLYAYLLQHPQVVGVLSGVERAEAHQLHFADVEGEAVRLPKVTGDKETRYFNSPLYRKSINDDEAIAMQVYYDLFPVVPAPAPAENRTVIGEGTPMYICSPGTAVEMHRQIPSMKYIFVLRDPVERSYSEFQHRRTLESRGDAWASPAEFHYCMVVEHTICSYCMDFAWKQIEKGEHEKLVAEKIPGDYSGIYLDATSKEYYFVVECTDRLRVTLKSLLKQLQKKQEPPVTLTGLCDDSYNIWCSNPFLRELLDFTEDTFMMHCPPIQSIRNGLYDLALLEWLRVIPADQILILFSKEFYADPSAALEQVERFLGISHHDRWPQITSKVFNILRDKRSLGQTEQEKEEATAYPPMRNSTRELLERFFAPSRRRLELLLKRPMPW
eukprot:TRINITY_DN23532_c0_g1_i1.p1 TRINITY_DN23532_c0_g1~~TRINITY_DN23532_c0_g1_i1.p1  ORF type:complete len:544 (+),score=94.15 TRINITY_DN23532_c0_g1_i1:65-1696(+)